MAKSTQDIMEQIAAIRRRVAERYPASGYASPVDDGAEPVPLADLMRLFEARDAADGKVAAIGKVNPRPGGAVNAAIQAGKRAIARALGWFIRDQVEFNAASVRAITETLEALNDVNRSLATLAAEQARLRRDLRAATDLSGEIRAEADARLREATDNLSAQTRAVAANAQALWQTQQEFSETIRSLAFARFDELEESVHAAHAAIGDLRNETAQQTREREREDIRLLRTLADVQNASRQQWSLLEAELRRAIDSRGSLAEERVRAAVAGAVEEAVRRNDAAIHRELRLLRQRVGAILERGAPSDGYPAEAVAALALAGEHGAFDSLAFSERFRGSEPDVKEKLRIYLPFFEGCSPVADLGCGRGEFLDLFREAGGRGVGVESNPELAGIVQAKGHVAVCADLFTYLKEQQADTLGGIFCAHVIEHMPAEALLRLLAEARRVLRPGGLLALETPNPSCLAIFATYFFLDPTHVRPVPSELVRYLLEETGFGDIQVMELHPAEAEFPQVKPLPEGFRQQFFGSLDYGVLARKPEEA